MTTMVILNNNYVSDWIIEAFLSNQWKECSNANNLIDKKYILGVNQAKTKWDLFQYLFLIEANLG